MKKYIFLLVALLIGFSMFQTGWAGVVDLPNTGKIEDVSIEYKTQFGGSLVDSVNHLGFSLLTTLKVILSGVLLIFVVYIGIQMILYRGSDDEQLSAAKRQISYVLIALIFINIPGSLFEAFYNQDAGTIGDIGDTWDSSSIGGSIFVNSPALMNSVNAIVGFVEMLIFSLAIMMFVIGGLNLVLGGSDEEDRKNAIQRIIWSMMGIIFVGFIELWKRVAISGNITGEDSIGGLFGNLIDIALFWAAPIAMVFLTLSGYYYITANGDDERIKKAKNTVIYTVSATLLLLAIFTFLIDLANLF